MSKQQNKPPEPLSYEEALQCDSGWMSPKAELYPAKYMHHHYFANYMSKDGTLGLENDGWIKLSPMNGWLFFADDIGIEPTEAQIEFIKDWCNHKGRKLPYWMHKPKNTNVELKEDSQEVKEAKDYVKKLIEEAEQNGKR